MSSKVQIVNISAKALLFHCLHSRFGNADKQDYKILPVETKMA